MKLNNKIKTFNYIRPEVELPASVYDATLHSAEEKDYNDVTRLVLDFCINNKIYRDSVTEDEIEIVGEDGKINKYSPAGVFLEALAKQIKYDEINNDATPEDFLNYIISEQVHFQVEVNYNSKGFRNIQVYRPKANKSNLENVVKDNVEIIEIEDLPF